MTETGPALMVLPPPPCCCRTQELHDQLDKLHDELHQLEADLEEHQSERSVKYKELKKKEEGIRGVWGRRGIFQLCPLYVVMFRTTAVLQCMVVTCVCRV